MNNIRVAKIVYERLPYLGLDVTVVSQKITDKDVMIGLLIFDDLYEYTISRSMTKRKINSNTLYFSIISTLEDFFIDLASRIYNNVEANQTTIYDDEVNENEDSD